MAARRNVAAVTPRKASAAPVAQPVEASPYGADYDALRAWVKDHAPDLDAELRSVGSLVDCFRALNRASGGRWVTSDDIGEACRWYLWRLRERG